MAFKLELDLYILQLHVTPECKTEEIILSSGRNIQFWLMDITAKKRAYIAANLKNQIEK